MAWRDSEWPFKCQTLEQPKLPQLDKMLCNLLTAVHSKGEPITVPMTEKVFL
jgi:hypothetical protein